MPQSLAYDPPSHTVRSFTLAQLTRDGDWRLSLAHDRPDHLLIWITRGQGVGLIDGARRGLGARNAVFVPAGTLMSLSAGRQTQGQVIVLPASGNRGWPTEVSHLRLPDRTAQGELAGHFEAIGREQNVRRRFRHTALAAHADLLAVWLRRQAGDAPAPPRPPPAARRLARAYCGRLVSHFRSGASVADHAASLGVTPTHLNRVCKSQIGKTASALQSERLLHAARRLLHDTDFPVQDIARHLGFASAGYFSRVVQQHTGLTPTALRNAGRSRR